VLLLLSKVEVEVGQKLGFVFEEIGPRWFSDAAGELLQPLLLAQRVLHPESAAAWELVAQSMLFVFVLLRPLLVSAGCPQCLVVLLLPLLALAPMNYKLLFILVNFFK
jgi:hypothetical protein